MTSLGRVPDSAPRVVVALGGNALLRKGQLGTISEQRATVAQACSVLAALHASAVRLIVTHGNGPQVGRLLVQNASAERRIPPMPLDVLGAQSQAQIGYLLQQALGAAIAPVPVVTLITQTVVDAADPAFGNPSKPIGPYLLAPAARALEARDVPVARDEVRGGWRRVVPSPKPICFLEQAAIDALIEAGIVPIIAGGGGVPVVADPSGGWRGVEAVVDKDLAAAVLAKELRASTLLILTDVEHVLSGRGGSAERSIGTITAAEARALMIQGEFPAGSMGPKVEAAISAAEAGARSIITSLECALDAMEGRAGTEIVP
ncbi:MAG: carbamate kinase [Actinomycetota bacterium]